MEIETERLILREIEEKDAEPIAKLLNNIEISKYLANVPFPYTIEHANEFVRRCRKNAVEDPRVFYEFVIILKEANDVVGVISLKELNHEEQRGEIVTWLDKVHWRKGFITEAMKKLLTFAFKETNMRRVDLTITSTNIPSRNLATKVGFHFDGISKNALTSQSTGEVHDVHKFYYRHENGVIEEETKESYEKRENGDEDRDE